MNKKTMNGWKVIIRETRASTSTHMRNEFACVYPVNEEVFPKLSDSKLFFFKNKEDAVRFSGEDEDIVACVATNPQELFGGICAYVDDLKRYWNGLISSHFLTPPPDGTWVADSITCLE